MPRISKIQKLSPDHVQIVEATIRQHHYAQLDEMLPLLSAQGVEVSRSALHRYAKRLSIQDGKHDHGGSTVVVIVSLSTGATSTLHTSATTARIMEEIEALAPSS